MAETPEQITNISECACGNTEVNTVYGKQTSEFQSVGNKTNQGGISSGVLANFYINKVLDTIMNLPVGCSLIRYKMSILCCVDDIVLLAPIAQTPSISGLSETARTLSLEI